MFRRAYNRTKALRKMNQHDFVRGCLAFYEEEGLTPEKGWDKAHYPAPENQGDATIWMTHNHHQHQGLLQSREYGQCCFYNGGAYQFLTEGPFVPGWFELWDIYDEYKGENGRKNVELGRGVCAPGKQSEGGKRSAELGVGVHGRSPDQMTEDGKKAGKKSAELGVGVHAPGKASEGGKATSAQKWKNTDPNHPPFTTNPGNLTRWQRARGIDISLRIRIL